MDIVQLENRGPEVKRTEGSVGQEEDVKRSRRSRRRSGRRSRRSSRSGQRQGSWRRPGGGQYSRTGRRIRRCG